MLAVTSIFDFVSLSLLSFSSPICKMGKNNSFYFLKLRIFNEMMLGTL